MGEERKGGEGRGVTKFGNQDGPRFVVSNEFTIFKGQLH